MSHLILIRHSNSAVVEDLPADQWHLSREGVERARLLVPFLKPYNPKRIYCSIEPKAFETAEILAGALGLKPEVVENLHEHSRTNVGWSTAGNFQDQVRRFFAAPSELVFGEESAEETQSRFCEAVEAISGRHSGESVAIATHGTVMTLFVSAHNDVDPFTFWSSLKMPCMVVLALPGYQLTALAAP